MGVRDLFFRITAQDDTKAAFASVASGLNKIDGATRTMRQRFADVGRTARNFGGIMSAAVTAPLLLAGQQMLTAFMDAEKAQALLEQAIRQTGGAAGFTAAQLREQAGALEALTAIDGDSIMQDVQLQLLTFGNISGEVFQRAQIAAMDLSTVLGSDLRSQTIQLGKALNDPIRGLGGLAKAGIQFSEEQKTLIEGFVKTNQIAKAQAIILDEVSRYYGGAAATAAGTLSGQIAGLGLAFEGLQEEFGGVLAGMLPPLIAGLRGLVDVFAALPDPVKEMIVSVGLVAGALGPVLGVVGLLTIGITAIAAPVLVAVGAFAALTAAVIAFWPEIVAAAQAVHDFVERADAAMNAGFDRIVATVTAFGQRVYDIIAQKLGQAFDYVSGVVTRIGDAFDELYNRVVGNSSVPDLVEGVLEEFKRLDKGAVASAESLSGEVSGIFEDLGRGVVGMFSDMAKQGSFSLKGLGAGLLNLGGGIASRIAGKGVDFLAGAAATELGIPGFAEGGSFTVGGAPGRDRNLVQFMATRGEEVEIRPAGRAGGGGVTVNIVTPDPGAFRASSAQLSAQIARAVARGQGRM